MSSEKGKPPGTAGDVRAPEAVVSPVPEQTGSVPRIGALTGGGAAPASRPSDATPSTRPAAAVPRGGARTFSPGDVLSGRYQIVRFIAQGGMGEVYEAKDRDLEERVALKTVRPELTEQGAIFARFKREIQLARKVTHPNVCRIFDLGHHRFSSGGQESQVSFLTMELLEGETLAQRLKRTGRMTSEQALPIVRQMVGALATAHEAGIVHRDFKSSNVMLVPGRTGERAVVTDFGLARGGVESGSLSLTGSGDMVGTPAYMAPEQIEGREIGPPADIYALGVVMYEMVTGTWPFKGDTPIQIAMKHLKERPIPPRSLVKDLDPRWEAAILRCLERDPGDRFGRANDVLRALGGEAVAPPRKARRPTARVAVVAAAVGLVLVGGYLLSRPAPGSGPTSGASSAAPSPSAAPTPVRPRRSLAVLGFKNLGRPEADWLSTAVSEMLRTELAAGERVRTIPGENVARMKVELKVEESDSLASDTLGRIRANLGADVVVVGSYLVAGKGGKIRLDARLQDTASGELLATVSTTGTEDEVFDLVSKAGSELRGKLGIGEVSSAEASGVKATLPANTQAARLYAEGLAKLRLFDALAARDRLEKAAAVDPAHPLVHSGLATAWSALGYDEKAKQEATRAFDLSQSLPREERLSVEGLLRETTGEWDKAVGIYRGLFVFFPDNLEYGLRLAAAQTSAGRGEDALATIESLRRLPAPASNDPRLDLAEAAAAKALTDFARQQKAAANAAAKAKAQDARLLLAQARLAEGTALVDLGRIEDATTACELARTIFVEAGDLAGAARTDNIISVALAKGGDLPGAKARLATALRTLQAIGDRRGVARQLGNIGNVLDMLGRRAEARKAYEEGLKVSREIGDRSNAAHILNGLALLLEDSHDLEGARRSYEEALRAFEEIGETRNAALALANIGEVLQKEGRSGDAVQKYEKSLKISREAGAKLDAAGTLTLIGELRLQKNDLDGAKQALEEALSIHREAGQKEEEAGVLRHLADVLKRRGDNAGAQKLLDQAAELAGGA